VYFRTIRRLSLLISVLALPSIAALPVRAGIQQVKQRRNIPRLGLLLAFLFALLFYENYTQNRIVRLR
jgi:ABC-type Co2+ transport system permease subunit